MRWIYGNNKTYSDKNCSKKSTATDFNEKGDYILLFIFLLLYYVFLSIFYLSFY